MSLFSNARRHGMQQQPQRVSIAAKSATETSAEEFGVPSERWRRADHVQLQILQLSSFHIMNVVYSVHIFIYNAPPAKGGFKSHCDLISQLVFIWYSSGERCLLFDLPVVP